jgi:hypothetical protein
MCIAAALDVVGLGCVLKSAGGTRASARWAVAVGVSLCVFGGGVVWSFGGGFGGGAKVLGGGSCIAAAAAVSLLLSWWGMVVRATVSGAANALANTCDM